MTRDDWMTQDDNRRTKVRADSMKVIRTARADDRLLIGPMRNPVIVLSNDPQLQRMTISYESDRSRTLSGHYSMWVEQGFVKA